jgi:NADP-dependent 3-hydroxy acid dehydrogenase YdfG
MTNPDLRSQTLVAMEKMAIRPAAVARAIAFAIEQPPDVDVSEIVVRPSVQG